MIEVFRTNIADRKTADRVIRGLQKQLPDSRISIDLEDCDRILRIECRQCPQSVTLDYMNLHGLACTVLDDL